MTDLSNYLSTKEVCAVLKCSRPTLYRYQNRDTNPFPKGVKRTNSNRAPCFYNPEEVENWIRKNITNV